jgi:hypothetical protein
VRQIRTGGSSRLRSSAVVAYRSNRINAAPGVEVLADDHPGRHKNAVLDVVTLPLVAAGPRKTVEALGARLSLQYGFHRWLWRTERCVELALGEHVLTGRDPQDVLEIGNVLRFAGLGSHAVIDKYERGPGVLNVDIVDYDPGRRFGLAVSISTLEHVGYDEDPRDLEKASRALGRVSELADDLLVTMPVGYHQTFERAFLEGPFDEVELLVKTTRRADWVRRTLTERHEVRYAAPYMCGNGILVGSRGLGQKPSKRS